MAYPKCSTPAWGLDGERPLDPRMRSGADSAGRAERFEFVHRIAS
jgi:hypothetical protein